LPLFTIQGLLSCAIHHILPPAGRLTNPVSRLELRRCGDEGLPTAYHAAALDP
jgi:hypothetical protein